MYVSAEGKGIFENVISICINYESHGKNERYQTSCKNALQITDVILFSPSIGNNNNIIVSQITK